MQETPSYMTPDDLKQVLAATLLSQSGKGIVQTIQNTPGHQQRMTRAKEVGKFEGEAEGKQKMAAQLLGNVDDIEQLSKSWLKANPGAFDEATGPFNGSEHSILPFGYGPNPGDTKYQLGKLASFAIGPNSWEQQQAFRHQLNHQINGLTTLYSDMIKGGGSNAKDERFEKAIGDMRTAPNPETFFSILHDIRNLVRQKGMLPVQGPSLNAVVKPDGTPAYPGQQGEQPPAIPDNMIKTISSPQDPEFAKIKIGQQFKDADGNVMVRRR